MCLFVAVGMLAPVRDGFAMTFSEPWMIGRRLLTLFRLEALSVV